MQLMSNGVRIDNLFPGLQFRQENDNFRMYVKPHEDIPEIIQVFGSPSVEYEKWSPVHREVILTLRGEDCELYTLLDWPEQFRDHGMVATAKGVVVLMILLGLTIIQWVGLAFWLATSSSLEGLMFFLCVIFSFLFGLAVSSVELWSYFTIRNSIRRCKFERAIDDFIFIRSQEMGSIYVLKLLFSLCGSNNKDVASETKLALKRFREY